MLSVSDGHEQAFHIAGDLLGEEGVAGAICQDLVTRVGDGAGNSLGVHIVLGGGDGGGITDPVHVGACDLGIAEEVDEGFRSFLLLGTGGDAHGVDEQVEALVLGQIECQILILGHHGQTVACIVGGDPGFLVLHGGEDLIHDVLLQDRLLLKQNFRTVIQFGGVHGVHIVTQHILGDAEGVTGVAEHQDLAGILLIPQQFPTCDIGFVNILGVVQDAHGTPGVGDRILVLRIVGGVAEAFVNILIVGNVVVVDLQQHILPDQTGDHIIRGDDHIHGDAAVGQLGVHDLVGVIGGIVDFDVGIALFELGDDFHGVIGAVSDILAPVVDIQCHGILGMGCQENEAEADQQADSQKTGADPLEGTHGLAVRSGAANGLGPVGAELKQVHGHHQHKDQQEQQGEHGIDLGLDGLLGIGIDLNRQGNKVQTRDEIADDEVVQAHGKGHDGAGDDAGHDLVKGDLEEGLSGSAA